MEGFDTEQRALTKLKVFLDFAASSCFRVRVFGAFCGIKCFVEGRAWFASRCILVAEEVVN